MWVENGLERLIGAELPKGVCVCVSVNNYNDSDTKCSVASLS